jgi:hypothetical protein
MLLECLSFLVLKVETHFIYDFLRLCHWYASEVGIFLLK